jgi:hypothetical protein
MTPEEQLAAARAAVEATRKARGTIRTTDSGADSGALGEDEERELADRSR